MSGTLADLFNAPTEFTLEAETFRFGQPNELHQGEFQRWLEQLAFDAIERRTYQSEAGKERAFRAHDQDCAAGVYEWGGELATRRVMTARGLAKLLEIICRDQGLTAAKAKALVEQEQRKIAATLASRLTSDPKELAALAMALGLPSEYFSSSSPIRRSASESTTSEASPTINS